LLYLIKTSPKLGDVLKFDKSKNYYIIPNIKRGRIKW